MASPHTAGTVALIWAAAPTLQGDIDRTMAVLNETAVDTENLTCGGTAADNNVWGEGRLDALAAVNLARLPVGTVTGHVTDAVSGRAIAGTRVVVSGPFERTSGTGSEGEYSFVLPAGDYTVTASAFGYRAEEATVTVREGETAVQDLLLSALPSGAVSGIVSSTFGPVGNATVTIDGTPIPATTTGADGRYAFAAVPTGNYRMTITAGGCLTSTTVDLTVNGDTTLDVTVPQRADGYGYTCMVEGAGYVEGDTALSLVGDDASAEIALPFPFFFYGATYSRAFVSTNGHLNFLAPSTVLSNVAIPATGVPNAAIYPLWDDLVVQNPGRSDQGPGNRTQSVVHHRVAERLFLQHPDRAGRFRGSAERGRQHRHAVPQSRCRSAGARQLCDCRYRERRRHRRIAVLVQFPGAHGRSVDPVRPATDRHDRRQDHRRQ